jgi:hypothetical protein
MQNAKHAMKSAKWQMPPHFAVFHFALPVLHFAFSPG